MKNKKTHIDDLFRRELGNYTEMPDPAIWESLARNLDAGTVSVPSQPPAPGPVPPSLLMSKWIWYFAVPALSMVAGFFMGRNWETIQQPKEPKQQAVAISQNTTDRFTDSQVPLTAIVKKNESVAEHFEKNDPQTSLVDAHTDNGRKGSAPVVSYVTGNHASESLATPTTKTGLEYNDVDHTPGTGPGKNAADMPEGPGDPMGVQTNTNTTGVASVPLDSLAPPHNVTKEEHARQEKFPDTITQPAIALRPYSNDRLTAGRRNVLYFFRNVALVPEKMTDEQLAQFLFPRYMRHTDSAWQYAKVIDTPGYENREATTYNATHEAYNKNRVSGPMGGNRGGFNTAGTKRLLSLPNLDMEGWLKAGYETGKANKLVASAYLQYNISPKVGIAIQPTVKYVFLGGKTLSGPAEYISDVRYTRDSGHVMHPHLQNDTTKTPRIQRNYFYTQQYDTFVISNAMAATKYFEFELPVIFKYKVTKRLGLQAGVLVNFSKTAQITESRTNNTITRYDTLSYGIQSTKLPVPPVRPPTNFFKAPTGTNISQYDATPYLNAEANSLRWGYSVGVSYAVHDRIALEVVVQQMLLGNSGIPNKTVRDIYTQPYVRAMLGYRLFKTKK